MTQWKGKTQLRCESEMPCIVGHRPDSHIHAAIDVIGARLQTDERARGALVASEVLVTLEEDRVRVDVAELIACHVHLADARRFQRLLVQTIPGQTEPD